MQKLAQSFGMSDVGLAKICRKANVPVPPRGYWAKLQAGKSVDSPPSLPLRDFGLLDGIDIGPAPPPNRHGSECIPPEPPHPPRFDESLEDVANRARRLVGEVRVAKNLSAPHRSIAGYLKRDDERRLKQQQSQYPLMWDAPLFASPLERRRLRILNALFATLDRCGVSAGARGREARELSALVGSTHVPFSLEPIRRTRRETGVAKCKGDDALRFELQWWTSGKPPIVWEDTQSQLLEGQLAEIATQILVMGEAMLRDWQQQRYCDELKDWEALIEKVRLKREAEERAERERIAREQRERIDNLLADVSAWRRAQDIRAYVHARLEDIAARTPGTALQEWANWALRTADHIDPLCERLRNDGTDDEHPSGDSPPR